MVNEVINEYHVWLNTVNDSRLSWDEYQKLIPSKLREAIQNFVKTPLQLIEYSRSGGFLNEKDEKHYNNLYQNRRELESKLNRAFSITKVSDNQFAVVCDFSKLLDSVPDRKQLEDKYLFDYTEEELKLNEMYEVTDEVYKKFQVVCAKPSTTDLSDPEFKKIRNVGFDSKFIQVSKLEEINNDETKNQEEKQKVRRVI